MARAGDGVRRRDFIHIAAVSFAGVGAAAVAVPLVSQMSASADVLALASIEVDVAAIQPGQAIKTSWRKQPVFIRNLTPQEIAEANKVNVRFVARTANAGRTDPAGQGKLADHLGVCTHLGCVPLALPRARSKANMAAISAHATARIMIPPGASAKVRLR